MLAPVRLLGIALHGSSDYFVAVVFAATRERT